MRHHLRTAAPLLLSAVIASPVLSSAIPEAAEAVSPVHDQPRSQSQSHAHIKGSKWYDWGWYGAYPRTSYESFGAQSPWPNLLQTDDRCDDGFLFIEPRGVYVETPGPMILDNDGNLVWMDTVWGQAMDVKVQQFQGKNYITFWHGTDNGTFGEGYYLMLDEHYNVVKKILPVGEGLTGDLHEFRITDRDTALMTIYQKIHTNMSADGITDAWIFDSIFQEVDLVTDELVFEWRASDHFAASDSLAALFDRGGSIDDAFDFYHINSIDTDFDGNYIISSRYFCSVVCISHRDGSVIWQLGGAANDFDDLSDGAATDFAWNHHASWYDKERGILTIFDNGSWGEQTTATLSRGLMIQLDTNLMTATLVQDYIAPQELLSPSQGSVQALPNGNILVGWGHSAAWTEYTVYGEVLCDTHIAPLWFANFGWVKNYRTFKFPWVGRPLDSPSIAMRPSQRAVYVSWNGATEVRAWQLQSGPSYDYFEDVGDAVPKTTFETRLEVPADAGEFIHVAALDAKGKILGYSKTISKHENTITPLLEAPSRGIPPEPFTIFIISFVAAFSLVWLAYMLRSKLKRGVSRVLRKGVSTYNYQLLPMKG